MENKNNMIFVSHCAHLALSLLRNIENAAQKVLLRCVRIPRWCRLHPDERHPAAFLKSGKKRKRNLMHTLCRRQAIQGGGFANAASLHRTGAMCNQLFFPWGYF